jgi:hypothetical protein
MVSAGKQRRRKSRGKPRDRAALDRLDPLRHVVEYGGELIFAVGSTPGGAPFGPRVEIVDGELRFPEEEACELDGDT